MKICYFMFKNCANLVNLFENRKQKIHKKLFKIKYIGCISNCRARHCEGVYLKTNKKK
jgi:predicted metal-binding protein